MKDIINCKNDTRSFIFDKIYEDIFIYGSQVNDFLALDKEQLFTLHHGAILSLDKTQCSVENDINTLRHENEGLKNQVNNLKIELELIKTHLGI